MKKKEFTKKEYDSPEISRVFTRIPAEMLCVSGTTNENYEEDEDYPIFG